MSLISETLPEYAEVFNTPFDELDSEDYGEDIVDYLNSSVMDVETVTSSRGGVVEVVLTIAVGGPAVVAHLCADGHHYLEGFWGSDTATLPIKDVNNIFYYFADE